MSPLLDLPTLRPQYGPPLSLDRQLRRFLQPQVLYALPLLCDSHPHLLTFLRNPPLHRINIPHYQQNRGHIDRLYHSYHRRPDRNSLLHRHHDVLQIPRLAGAEQLLDPGQLGAPEEPERRSERVRRGSLLELPAGVRNKHVGMADSDCAYKL